METKPKRKFYRSHKAWYANSLKNKINIMIGLYPDEGGCIGEFEIEWYPMNGTTYPKLEIYDSSWGLFSEFSDLFAKMEEIEDMSVTEEEFIEILVELGIEDGTQYEMPDKYKKYTFVERFDSYYGDQKAENKEERILFEILKDLRGRGGLEDVWEEIDEEIQNEILQAWYNIINK